MPEHIKREALIKDIGDNVIFTVRGGAKLPTAEMRGANKVIDRIKNQPTADVTEVKYGNNITKQHPVDEFICSECGFMCEDFTEKVYDEDGDYFYYREYEFNYCPNCGAKMDKE